MPYIVNLDFSSGVRVVCELVDEPELEKLLESSPFEAEAERWGDEVYFELPVKLELRGERIAVMDKGKILQYDEPHVVYEKPANIFVAGFLGSPPMNFVDATIVERDSRIILDAGVFELPLPQDLAKLVKEGATSDKVVIGFRPEYMTLSIKKTPDSVFQADVYVVEPMGSSYVVDLKAGEYLLKAITPVTTRLPPIGGKVWVGLLIDKLHIFDAKTEKAIF